MPAGNMLNTMNNIVNKVMMLFFIILSSWKSIVLIYYTKKYANFHQNTANQGIRKAPLHRISLVMWSLFQFGGGIDFIYAQTNDAFGQIKTVNVNTGKDEIIGSWNERFSYTDEDIEASLRSRHQGYGFNVP